MAIAVLPDLFGPDGVVLLGLILLLIAAKKLPELGRGLGQTAREFSAKDDFHNRKMPLDHVDIALVLAGIVVILWLSIILGSGRSDL